MRSRDPYPYYSPGYALFTIIGIVVVVLFFGWQYYGQRQEDQEPTKVTTTVPVTPKPPPPGETHETGHWHGDHWHSTVAAHQDFEPVEWEVPLHTDWFSDADGNWYPPDYTQADIQADLVGEAAATEEEYQRRAIKNLVNNYIREHREDYPDCAAYWL